MGLEKFRSDKEKYENSYVNLDVVLSNIRSSSIFRSKNLNILEMEDLASTECNECMDVIFIKNKKE